MRTRRRRSTRRRTIVIPCKIRRRDAPRLVHWGSSKGAPPKQEQRGCADGGEKSGQKRSEGGVHPHGSSALRRLPRFPEHITDRVGDGEAQQRGDRIPDLLQLLPLAPFEYEAIMK